MINSDCVNYKIVEVGVVKLHQNNVPYFAYTIVVDDNNNRYMLDYFNTEILVKGVANNKHIDYVSVISLMCINYTEIVRAEYSIDINDSNIEKIAERNDCKLLYRIYGMSKVEKMVNYIDEEQKSIMLQYAKQNNMKKKA